jgi:hypothetical protein
MSGALVDGVAGFESGLPHPNAVRSVHKVIRMSRGECFKFMIVLQVGFLLNITEITNLDNAVNVPNRSNPRESPAIPLVVRDTEKSPHYHWIFPN